MNEVRQIAHNTIVQIIGKALTISLALISFGLIARYLGQIGFGHFSTIYAYMAIFGILVDLGLQMTTTKLIADPQADETKILNNALGLRLISSVVFLTIAGGVAWLMPYETVVKLGIIIAIVGFTSAALTTVLTSHFQKKLAMHQMVIAELTGKIISLLLIIAAINSNLGLLGIITATMLDSLIILVVAWQFGRRHLRLAFSFNWLVWQKIIAITWPIGLTIALNLIYFKGDIFIMSLLRRPEEVGLYGAPYRVLEVLINFIYLILGLLLPIMAAAWATNDLAKLRKVLQGGFDFLIILALPMIVGGYFVGKPLMILVAGSAFAISGEIIKILLLATGTIFIAGLFGYAIVAIGHQKQMIKFYAVNAIVAIIGYIYFIIQYSYWGAAWMTVVTELFILLSTVYVLKKEINFLPNLKIVAKTLAASLIMAMPLAFLPSVHFLILIILGTAVYFISLYLLKGFDKKLVLEIIRLKKNETPDHQA